MKRIITFTGQRPQSIGSGYPPRSLMEFVVTTASSEKADSGFEYDVLEGAAVTCYVPQDNGTFIEFPQGKGSSIRLSVSFPDGKNTQADEIREKEIKGVLLGAGVYAEHAQQAQVPLEQFLTDALKGQLEFDATWLVGRRLFVVYDPPPQGYVDPKTNKNGFPEIRVITGRPDGGEVAARAEHAKLVTGEKRFQWPYDLILAKAQNRAAVGPAPTGASAMLPGQGAGPAAPGGPGGPDGPTPFANVQGHTGHPTPGGLASPTAGGPALPAGPTSTLPTNGGGPVVLPSVTPAGPTPAFGPPRPA